MHPRRKVHACDAEFALKTTVHTHTHIRYSVKKKEHINNDAVPFVVHFRASPAIIVGAEHFTKSQNQQVKKIESEIVEAVSVKSELKARTFCSISN